MLTFISQQKKSKQKFALTSFIFDDSYFFFFLASANPEAIAIPPKIDVPIATVAPVCGNLDGGIGVPGVLLVVCKVLYWYKFPKLLNESMFAELTVPKTPHNAK